MRAHAYSRSIVVSAGLGLLSAIASGCGTTPPASDNDAAVLSDAGNDAGGSTVDAGRDTGTPPVDGGMPALCTGAGCEIVAIELMAATSCIRRGNGQVDCWGRGQDGELGDGAMGHSDDCRRSAGESTVDCTRYAVTVATPSPALETVSRGSIQSCGLFGTDHQVWCWGGQFYRLGATLEHRRYAPEHVLVGGDAVADGAIDLATSFSNLCWVNADHTAECVGAGGSGRLGNGAFDDAPTPVTVLQPDGMAPLAGVVDIETSGGHTCALTDTALYCWGNNHYGQIGSGPTHQSCFSAPTTYDCSYLPVEVTGIDVAHVVDLQLGSETTCVLLDDGHVQCFGSSQAGTLGNDSMLPSADPVEPMGLTNVTELRVVDGNACALRQDGTVWCWGPGNVGQIGDGQRAHSSTLCIDGDGAPYDCAVVPTQVMGLTGATHISVGEGHVCAVVGTSEVWCWGDSLRYQLGDGMRTTPAFAPVRVIALGN